MNALHSLIPNWLHHKDEEYAMPDDPIPPPPSVARLPELPPSFDQADHDREIFGRAAVLHDQLKRELINAERREQELQVQLTEALLSREGDTQKVSFLELENAELRNTIAGLQSDVEAYRQFMSSVKKVLDNFGITAPQKKPRNGKPKLAEQIARDIKEGTFPEKAEATFSEENKEP